MRRRPAFVFLLASLLLACVSSATAQDKPLVTVLRSNDAHGDLSQARVSLALRLAAEELKVTGRLPRVVVVLTSQESAEVIDLPHAPETNDQTHVTSVVTERRLNGELLYYFWLVEEPTDRALARGMVQVLLMHENRPLTNMTQAVLSVTTRLRAQVAAQDLYKGH